MSNKNRKGHDAPAADQRGWLIMLSGWTLLFASLVIIFGLWMVWVRFFTWGTVTVENRTAEPIVAGGIQTEGRRHKIPPLAPGRSYGLSRRLKLYGGYMVVVRTASGRFACDSVSGVRESRIPSSSCRSRTSTRAIRRRSGGATIAAPIRWRTTWPFPLVGDHRRRS